MISYNVLDLCPVVEGAGPGDALRNGLDLARHAEAWGYRRYWVAEHHNMPGIASAATAVVMANVAAGTTRIRVGSGGIMLPNHSPLVVAEQFGTLAALHGERIDLGVGRAPGTDMATARALRREQNVDTFPDDVLELMSYLGPPEPDARTRAIPGEGTEVPIWILGSSLYGAQLAAALGLPYAFASHFAPPALDQAVALYRSAYRPSPRWPQPCFMLAVNVFAGADDAEGRYLMSSHQQAMANLRSGRPGLLPPPVEDVTQVIDPRLLSAVDAGLACTAVGSPASVRRRLQDLIARHRPQEIIIAGQIYDHAARLRSFEIAAQILSAPALADAQRG